MNKSEFLQALEQFLQREGLDRSEVGIVAGGACVMRGVRSDTKDIDLGVSLEVYNKLVQKYPSKEKIEGRLLTLDGVDIIRQDFTYIRNHLGWRVQTLRSILAYRTQLHGTQDENVRMLTRMLGIPH